MVERASAMTEEQIAKKIRAQLVKQLREAGEKNAVTLDLVDKYMEAREEHLPEVMAAILDILRISPKQKRRKEIEKEIRTQLEQRGLTGPVWEDKIDRFLRLWDAFQEANKSLKERGRTYITISSAGKEYEKDNSAAKDIVTFAKAMEDALTAMDITVKGYAEAAEDDDEL